MQQQMLLLLLLRLWLWLQLLLLLINNQVLKKIKIVVRLLSQAAGIMTKIR